MRRSASTCSALLTLARAKGTGGEVVSCPGRRRRGRRPPAGAARRAGRGEYADYRRAGAAVARAASTTSRCVTRCPPVAAPEALTAYVVGTMLGSFVFHWRSQGPEHQPVRRVVLAGLSGNDHASALERGLALGGAGWRSRMLATVPSNLKSPQWLAEQAERLADEAVSPARSGTSSSWPGQGFGGIIGVGQASATPPRLIRLDYTPARRPQGAARGPGRQGHHLRHRRAVDQAGRGHVHDEARHDRRRRGDGRDGRARRPRLPAPRHRTRRPPRRTPSAARPAARRRGHPLRRPHHRGHEHRRRRPAGARRRHGLRPRQARPGGPGRRRHPHRRRSRSPSGSGPAATSPTTTPWPRPGEPRARPPASRCGGCPLEPRLRGHPDLERRRRHQLPGGPGAITAALFLQHFAGDVPWAHLDIASTGDSPSDSFEWTTGPRASAPGPCSPG